MFERVGWPHLLAVIGLLAVSAFLLSPAAEKIQRDIDPSTGTVAVVELSGSIAFDNTLQDEGMSPETISSLTSRATDEGADAVIYEINSGGGSVVASREAARVVAGVDVPTVCRITEAGASGAYWMASACDRIVADPLSMTGSIGTRSGYLEVSGLLDRLGVEYVNLTSAEFKDMGSQFKNITPAERERFQEILDASHRAFVEDIAENRNMSIERVEAAATGEIYLGRTAKELGLVDRLGGHDTAVAVARNLTGTTELSEKRYSPSPTFDVLPYLFSKIGEGMAGAMTEEHVGIQARYRE